MRRVYGGAVVLFGAVARNHVVEAASSKMDYLPFVNVRTDPVIHRTSTSSHVHTFYGAVLPPWPDLTYDDLRNACTTSGNVEENKSLYWHPAIYKVLPDGTHELADIFFSSAYYIWPTVDDVYIQPGHTQAFPDGFQMLVDQVGTDGNLDPRTRVEFECADPHPCERTDSCEGGPHQTQEFVDGRLTFPTHRCGELEIKVVFPRCSDGRLDSPNHKDHVAYDDRAECVGENGVDDFQNSLCGECPPSHPTRIPEIQFYFRIVNYEGGHYVFSDGKGTVHSDYMSGWDQARLQQVLDECGNDSTAASPDGWCHITATNPNGLTYRDTPKENENVPTRCLLDQLQPPGAIDPTILIDEEITGINTLPSGAGRGLISWEKKDTMIPTCPERMSKADAAFCPSDDENEENEDDEGGGYGEDDENEEDDGEGDEYEGDDFLCEAIELFDNDFDCDLGGPIPREGALCEGVQQLDLEYECGLSSTNSPTTSPTSDSILCVDDSDWHVRGNPRKDCGWTKGKVKRCKRRSGDGRKGNEGCPLTCNQC